MALGCLISLAVISGIFSRKHEELDILPPPPPFPEIETEKKLKKAKRARKKEEKERERKPELERRKEEKKKQKEKERKKAEEFEKDLIKPEEVVKAEEEIQKAISGISKAKKPSVIKGLFKGKKEPVIVEERIETPMVMPRTYDKIDHVELIEEKIHKARLMLMDFRFDDAKKVYIEIIKMYNELEPKKKSKVYQDIKDLYYERKSAEKFAK